MIQSLLKSETQIVRDAYEAHGVLSGQKPKRAPTGFPCIDENIGGLTPGDMVVVAARPGVGKSTYLLHQMRAAIAAGFKCGLVSLEDSPVVLGERVQSYYSNVASQMVRKHGYTMSELKEILTQTDSDNMMFAFPDLGNMTEIELAMLEMSEQGVGVCAVDYLTAIVPTGEADLRTEYSKIIIHLKSLARKYNMVLILASQIARPKYNEKLGRYIDEPELHELAETSYLERAAELCIFLWKSKGEAFGKVAKLKFGGPMPKFRVSLADNGLYRTEVFNEDF